MVADENESGLGTDLLIDEGTENQAEVETDPYDRPVGANGMPECMCGCEGEVGKLKTKFIPGHDSKLKSLVGKVKKGDEPYESIPVIGRPYADELIAKA